MRRYIGIILAPLMEMIMGINFIFGQSHFIKTVEDIHEALVNTVPGIKFGIAFCEASGKCLVRWSGTDEAMIELARKNAMAVSAGHSFFIFLGEGYFPINGMLYLLRNSQPDKNCLSANR
jgi:adenosine/AMP kinase